MNKEKSQVLPNRKEWRASMRRFKHLRVAKKTKTKGAFGGINQFLGSYKSLRVIPLHKRTKENSNKLGIIK